VDVGHFGCGGGNWDLGTLWEGRSWGGVKCKNCMQGPSAKINRVGTNGVMLCNLVPGYAALTMCIFKI
jgi:hypothetical protein